MALRCEPRCFAILLVLLSCCVPSTSVAGKKRKSRAPPEACNDGMKEEKREKQALLHLEHGRSSQGDAAITSFSMAIACSKRGLPEAHFHRAMILETSGKRNQQAHDDLKVACSAAASYAADACMTLGVWSSYGGDIATAHGAFAMAVSRDVLNERAWSNYGVVSQQLGRFSEALRCYRCAAALKPSNAMNFFNMGKAQQDMGMAREAIASFRRAVVIDPTYFEAYASWGGALTPTRRWRRASEILRDALKLQPGSAEGLYLLAFALMHTCEWRELDHVLTALASSVATRLTTRAAPGVEPYASLTFPWHPSLLKSIAQSHADAAAALAHAHVAGGMRAPKGPRKGELLHVGIKSYDIGEHQSSYLVVELFTSLANRRNVQLSVYCLRRDDGSELRRAIQGTDGLRFTDVSTMHTGAIAERINADAVHVLVDMDAHFRNSRLELMASRSAPVQLVYPFFVGTAGAAFMPHMFNDKTTTPPEHAWWFTEKFIYLPHTYYVNSHMHAWKGVPPVKRTASSREAEGLPKKGAVLANFNQFYKLDGSTFEIWMRVMRAVPDSVLWLRHESDDAHEALRDSARAHGVDATRIVFARWATTSDEHLERSTLGTLSLDTPEYSSMTTACDMLWSGVPLVTLPQTKMVSRLASSLLLAMHVPSLIARDLDDYAELASTLAAKASSNHRVYHALRKEVGMRRTNSDLFGMDARARAFEAGVRMVWELFKSRKGDVWHSNLVVA